MTIVLTNIMVIVKTFDNLFLKLNNFFLDNFFYDLDKFNNLKTQRKKTEKKKTNVYNTGSVLYNDLLGISLDEYELSDAKRKKAESKYDPDKLFLNTYNYVVWLKNKKS